MDKIQSPKLTQELEPLKARIDKLNAARLKLEQALGQVEAELEALAGDRPRYEALKEVCAALGKLDEQDAKELFWQELPEVDNPEQSMDRLCRLPGQYKAKIESTLEKRDALREKLHSCCNELYHLDGQVYDAHLREQKRQDEFVVERDITFFPMRAAVMPWTKDSESERYFRRSILIALLLSFLFGGIVPLVNIPVPDRTAEVVAIPERIAKLVKSPPVIPEPPPAPKVEKEELKPVEEEKPEKKEPEPKAEKKIARKKVQNKGVLAFKETFKDLIVDTPTARLGSKTRNVDNASRTSGNSLSRRSLVAMQASGTSGGINASAISRSLGNGSGGSGKQIGAVGFSRVESAVANLDEKEGRSSVSSPKPARTDEDIQIVFDRYKATLYRIYNKELRKNPSLRGNILLRITIETGGEVSACSVESTDLASPELVKKIVARVMKFNFGPKKDAPKVTILYPIDFLPAR